MTEQDFFDLTKMNQALLVQMDEFKRPKTNFHIRPHNPNKSSDEIEKHYQKCQIQLEYEYSAHRPVTQFINYKKPTDSSAYKKLDNNIKLFRSAANQAVQELMHDIDPTPQTDQKWAQELLQQIHEKPTHANPALQIYPLNRYAPNLLVIDFKSDEKAQRASYLVNSRGIECYFMREINSIDTSLAKPENRSELSSAIEKGKGFIKLPPRIIIDISQPDFQNHLAVRTKINALIDAQKAEAVAEQEKEQEKAAQTHAKQVAEIQRLKEELFTEIHSAFPAGGNNTPEAAQILADIMQASQTTAQELGADKIFQAISEKKITSLAGYRTKNSPRR